MIINITKYLYIDLIILSIFIDAIFLMDNNNNNNNNNHNHHFNYDIFLPHSKNIYPENTIILKARVMHHIKSSRTTAASSRGISNALLVDIEHIYLKDSNLLNFTTQEMTKYTNLYSMIFIYNNKFYDYKELMVNKNYIFYFNKSNFLNQFYTLINLKANRYFRVKVPKINLLSNFIDWNELNENELKYAIDSSSSSSSSSSISSSGTNGPLLSIKPDTNNLNVNLNENVELECLFNGYLPKYITWKKYNRFTKNLDDLINVERYK
jgi:hypothetical protein